MADFTLEEDLRGIAFDQLRDYEARWRDRQPFLQSRGYTLRPRLRPGWTPSWLTTGKHPLRSEDGIFLPVRPHLVDATRTSDGKLVYIKRVETGDTESSLAIMLSSLSTRFDSRNHSVPVLDSFIDNEDPSISYIVMPFLMEPNFPDFETVGEIVDFVDQVLEVRHFCPLDCSFDNIMMDCTAMYPRGLHPINTHSLPDGFTPVLQLPRRQVGVTYYFIDYGISSYYPPGTSRGMVIGRDGRDQDVPELSDTKSYDPFAVDIFIIGNMLRLRFREEYSNVEFLAPIIAHATARDPAQRPSAQELLQEWTSQRRQVSSLTKEWRLKRHDENLLASVVRDCLGMVAAVAHLLAFWRRY
ncbi:hypothetical protein K488DRAFT_41089 [Vararia minispora EC-137]|uniref:Uncharacterized protein n=1 Tax=Vararia minispora EC-137 TaxID=1314806 RepID=A0ACB8QXZ0_9AGAM|nr:hypothetical protein K488DRAFT_41089 [Vararia minispora EC-137]